MHDSLDRFLPFFFSSHSDQPPRNPSFPSFSSCAFCEQRGHLGAPSSCFTILPRTRGVG